MTTLIIAEKVAVRDAIAVSLGSPKVGTDPIYYKDYIITNLYGHILTLKEPEDYDGKYKKWNMNELPIYFDKWGNKPKKETKDKLKMIGELLKKADQVIHAGDPDDEGQLLVDEVLDWFNYKGKVLRVNTSNTEKDTLAKQLNNLKDNEEFKPQGYAAYARSVADLIVGVNMSRYFTLLHGGGNVLSVGRVQTPTLGLVVKRDEIIENHIKQKYYTVEGEIYIEDKEIPITVKLAKDDPRLTDGKITNKADAEGIAEALSDRIIPDVEITKKNETEQPPLPFNLVELQSYCGTHFHYSLQDVMATAQDLKDKYKAISYHRTDCRYLSEEHYQDAPETIKAVCQNIQFTPSGIDTTIKSKAFNDDKISVHHGIVPTKASVDISKMSEKEKNVYLAVCKYYLAQFLPPCKKVKTTLKRETKHGIISSSSTEIVDSGYRSIFKEAEKDEVSDLSSLKEGLYEGETDTLEVIEKETQPPKRYTEHTLNKDMTSISKYVDDPEIKGLLLAKDADSEDNGSIGTDATRTFIIQGLIKRKFLEKDKDKIKSTELGRKFYNMLPDELKKPDMTALWWVMQEQIKKKEISAKELPESVLETCKNIMNSGIKPSEDLPTAKKKSSVLGNCPLCGNTVYKTKKGGAICKGFFDKTCEFSLWPEHFHKKLSETELQELIANKETSNPVKGLKVNKENVSKVLYINDEGKVQFR